MQEFSSLLSTIMRNYKIELFLGDFNFHVCYALFSVFASDFIKILESFSLNQHVEHRDIYVHDYKLNGLCCLRPQCCAAPDPTHLQ